MPLIPIYCEKCGHTGFSFLQNVNDEVCFVCHTKYTTQPIPEKYLEGIALNEDLKEEFFETVVKTSPNFDQAAHDRLQEVYANRKRQDEMLKQNTEEQKNVPKCPTCGSTNIRKVSATSKAVSVGLFGIFSQKVKKQFHCGNCGYEW